MRKKLFLSGIAVAVIAGMFMSMPVSAESTFDRADVETKINGLIEETKDKTPSVAVAVFDGENDIHIIYGKSDMENDIPANEDTVYEWGSVSKLLVWTSAMQLYEQGKLDLNKDICSYLPEGFLSKLNYDTPITMTDLMNHSAGFLTPYKEIETDDINAIKPLGQALKEVEPVQRYEPGKAVAYSNYGAALAGYIVECISGMSYADYVKQNIFEKLGMQHTALCPDLSDNEWVAEQRKKTHCYADGHLFGTDGLASLGECRRYIHLYPAGSACGTLSDLETFVKAFVSDSKDCPLFEKENTLDEMLTPSRYFSDGKTGSFYHGFMIEKPGMDIIGHGGNTEGFSSLVRFDTKSKTGFVMMTNTQQDRIYSSKLPELLYGSPDTASLKTDNFTKYDFSGHYKITGGVLETGCFSLYSFFEDNFEVKEENGVFVGNLGVTSIEQISDYAAISKLITGSETVNFIRTDENGNFTGLENGSFDFIKISDLEYYLGWTALILMIIGLAVLTVMAFIHIIRIRKFRGQPQFSFKITEMLIGITAAAILLCIVLMLNLDMLDDIIRAVLCIAIAVLSAVLLAVNIVAWVKKPDKNAKFVLLLENLCSIFIIFGVVYWKLFQFWGF